MSNSGTVVPGATVQDPERVGFLVAGVQKAGTTALFDHLIQHPDLVMAPVKEVHYFDDESVDWDRPDHAAYHAAFPDGAAGLRGEATPIYIYWPRALERIAAYNPAMRLILLFRDPVERAWSQWKMERGRTETEPFSWCIRQGRARVSGAADGSGAHRIHSYVERGFYGAQVRRLLALFPREQVLFLGSDSFRRDPERILGNVCNFLGIPPFGEVEPLQSHVGPPDDKFTRMSAEDRLLLEQIFEQDQKEFEYLTGLTLRP
ncbi:sulfotransferase domain-containing protein [Brevundimonas sp. R86498]|uniref:sulfotransferase domain-containing protein n=1 Tax=Brevundimonas sp. R86498 TaxID=3093845 RepID=UPI0037C6E491